MMDEYFANRTTYKEPFPYFVTGQALPLDRSHALLDWLERDAPWKLVEADFYEQFEFNFRDAVLPREIQSLFSDDALERVKSVVEASFGIALSARKYDVTAHKLVSGQRIRIHNDCIPGGETHRVLIQLNRGWQDENGGTLMLFNSFDPSDIHRAYRPLHNSCVGFEVSRKSLHAVSTIHSGERFTLVYSFYHSEQ